MSTFIQNKNIHTTYIDLDGTYAYIRSHLYNYFIKKSMTKNKDKS